MSENWDLMSRVLAIELARHEQRDEAE